MLLRSWLLVAGLLAPACAHGTAARTSHANLVLAIGDDGAPEYLVLGKRYRGGEFDALTERVLAALQAAGVTEVRFWRHWKTPLEGMCADYRRFRAHGIEIKALWTPAAFNPHGHLWRDLGQACAKHEGPVAHDSLAFSEPEV